MVLKTFQARLTLRNPQDHCGSLPTNEEGGQLIDMRDSWRRAENIDWSFKLRPLAACVTLEPTSDYSFIFSFFSDALPLRYESHENMHGHNHGHAMVGEYHWARTLQAEAVDVNYLCPMWPIWNSTSFRKGHDAELFVWLYSCCTIFSKRLYQSTLVIRNLSR